MHIDFKNLIKQEVDDKLLFGAQVRFQLEEPFTQTVSIDGNYRIGIYKLNSDSRVLEDDWSAYEDAAQALLNDLIVQLRSPQPEWHSGHAREKHSFSQFSETKELFND